MSLTRHLREKGDFIYMSMCKVTNRSHGYVGYTIAEDNVRRQFAPGETKNISSEELEKLSYQKGGLVLMSKYFLIHDKDFLEDTLQVKVQPEYYMTEEDVKKLLLTGSLDEFLDCLDFAPAGVIQIIKDLAVSLPLNDVAKRNAIKEKTHFDVDRAVANMQAEKEEDAAAPVKERRVQKEEASTEGRRTPPKTYNVVG